MALQVSSSPVSIPSGIRVTAGTIDFNGATYSTGGLAVTNAQWGAGANGIPNRAPDFVIFGGGSAAATDNATTASTTLRYIKATGKVAVYGTEPLVDEEGLGEDDGAADNTFSTFIAIWVSADPAGVTLA